MAVLSVVVAVLATPRICGAELDGAGAPMSGMHIHFDPAFRADISSLVLHSGKAETCQKLRRIRVISPPEFPEKTGVQKYLLTKPAVGSHARLSAVSVCKPWPGE